MQRGTPTSEKGKRTMPRRKYAPVHFDEDDEPWCAGCGLRRLPPKSHIQERCVCDEPPPGKRRRPRRDVWV